MDTMLVKKWGLRQVIHWNLLYRRQLLLLPPDKLTKALLLSSLFVAIFRTFKLLRLGSPSFHSFYFILIASISFLGDLQAGYQCSRILNIFLFFSYPYSPKLEMPGFRPSEQVWWVITRIIRESRSPDESVGMGYIQGQAGKSSASQGQDLVWR